MRIGIIGGGAAGLVTAWLLDAAHDVTLFEAAPTCGGHIRTLGKNTDRGRVPEGVVLDNGVIEFEPTAFIRFHQLLDALGVETETIPGSTSLFQANGRRLVSPGALWDEDTSVGEQLALYARLLPLAAHDHRFRKQAEALVADPDALYASPISDLLGEDVHCVWLRMLLMYAYSTPYAETGRIAAALAAPVLSHMTNAGRWTRIVGGVYTYCERILTELRGEVHTACPVVAVRRTIRSAHVTTPGGDTHVFDRVVFATRPSQVLGLLADASDDERRRFGGFRSQRARTVIHNDFSMYTRWDAHRYSEFDLFELGSDVAGYNAYLNRLCGVDEQTPYGMAYGLDDLIAPEAVLQTEEHTVPCLTVDAVHARREIIARNGDNNTFFAGAWLDDGLHEGAVVSALAVSQRLGGRRFGTAGAGSV